MIFTYIGNGLIFCSIVFVLIGLFGIFRFNDFYSKVLSSSKIDTLAMITLIIGVAIRSGLNWFTLKVLLIMIFVIFLNPIITSRVILSYQTERQCDEEGVCEVELREKV